MRKLNARELKALAKLKRKHRIALDKHKAKMDDGVSLCIFVLHVRVCVCVCVCLYLRSSTRYSQRLAN